MSRLSDHEINLIHESKRAGLEMSARLNRHAPDARSAAEVKPRFGFPLEWLTKSFVAPLRRAACRKMTAASLNRLSDRMLDDIGLVRADIERVAGQMTDQAFECREDNKKGLARTITEWLQRGKAKAQLESLSDRMLDDIGIERGDIAKIVDSWFVDEKPARARSVKTRVNPVLDAKDFQNIRPSRKTRKTAA